MTTHFPDSQFLRSIFNERPPKGEIIHYKEKNMMYILDAFFHNSFTQEKKRDINGIKEEGWFTMISKNLQMVVSHYEHYRAYLIRHGILYMLAKSHKKGKNGTYYKFNPEALQSEKEIEYEFQPDFIQKIKKAYLKMNTGIDMNNPAHKHIIDSTDQLSIDYLGAIKLINERGFANKRRYISRVQKINDGIHKFKRSHNNGRMFTPIALPKILRPLCKLDGSPLAGMDITNAGPMLLMPLFEDFKSCLAGEKNKCKLMKDLSIGIENYKNGFNIELDEVINIDKFNLRFNDLLLFRKLVSKGEFSNFVFNEINKDIRQNPYRSAKQGGKQRKKPLKEIPVDKIKLLTLKYLNSDFRKKNIWGEEKSRIAEVFEKHFPTVVKLIDLYKNYCSTYFEEKDKHKYYALVILTMESRLVIESLGHTLAEKKILWAPLHDCAYVKIEDLDNLKYLMLENFNKHGLAATIKTNMYKDDISFFINNHGIVFETRDDNLVCCYHISAPEEKLTYDVCEYILGLDIFDVAIEDLNLTKPYLLAA